MKFLQAVVDGLSQGSVYALVALGFVVIYKATKVVSFAQPALTIVGGLFAYHFTQRMDMSFWVGLVLAIVCGALVGVAVERLALRPMIGKPVFTLAIITVGADIVLRTLAGAYTGPLTRYVAYPNGGEVYEFGGISITAARVGLIAVTVIAIVALLAFFRFTRYGLAMRATAIDQETAMAQGIRVGVVFALAWGIAGGLAAIAGTFQAAGQGGIDQTTWTFALLALAAIIIGGLDSIPGAIIGGLAVGLVMQLTAIYQPGNAEWLGRNFSEVAPFALMFLVLLVRPYGLFGTKEVERV